MKPVELSRRNWWKSATNSIPHAPSPLVTRGRNTWTSGCQRSLRITLILQRASPSHRQSIHRHRSPAHLAGAWILSLENLVPRWENKEGHFPVSGSDSAGNLYLRLDQTVRAQAQQANLQLLLRQRDGAHHRIAAIRVSPEGREGIGAFLDKRKPAWTQS